MPPPLVESSQFEVLVDGLDHPECVTWGPDSFLYAGGEAGQVYRISLGGKVDMVATTGGFVLGLCLDGAGNIYACDPGNKAIMRVSPAGEVTPYFQGIAGEALVNPNYAVFSPEGDLYFSDSGSFGDHNGRLYVVHPGGQGQVWRQDLAEFPNGLALAPDQSSLYVVLSTLPGVARAPLAGGPIEVKVTFDRKVPDGVAFDCEGNLYISCYTPDEIWRLSSTGKLELFAEDWRRTTLAAPTNVAFCGAALDTLVVANLGRWHLAKTSVSTPGLPYHYPVLRPPPS